MPDYVPRLETHEDLWRLLYVMVRNKVERYGEHHRAVKRDIHRLAECSSEEIDPPSAASDPSGEVATKRAFYIFAARLQVDEDEMLALYAKNKNMREIAEQVGATKDAVRVRVARPMCRLWEELHK